MVAAMLISHSWLKACGTFPLKRILFHYGGCKRRAGIFLEKPQCFSAVTAKMVGFDACDAQKKRTEAAKSAQVEIAPAPAGCRIGWILGGLFGPAGRPAPPKLQPALVPIGD
jgi:hypothetical protein